LRYFNVFGPRQDPLSQYSAVIPNFLTAVSRGERPTIFGDGTQTRDFTYVSNIVHANCLAMTANDVAGKVLNVACGGRISLNQVVAEMRELTGHKIEPRYVPARAGDVSHSMASIERARAVLGFEPMVSFREGLALTIEHFERAAMSPQTA
jgi:nucleoside-diphosphate-sugar epimerase